ncbi:trehalase-domain-containing protein [Hyaloraphidium curvatum]|nr:trehalase-domain-containing protein [Hyaloraphidium curvatum]
MHYGIASPPAVGPPVLPAPPGPRRRQASGQRDPHIRRSSHDENFVTRPRSFYVDVEDVQRRLLAQEDRDGDFQITVTDRGPKVFPLNTAASGGYKKHEVRGTYMLSNLLQELALASDYGRKYIVVSEDRLSENPVERLHRMIKYYFWDELTRRIDADGLEIITDDPKNRSPGQHRRIYVPFRDKAAQQYYLRVAQERPRLGLEVEVLPEVITPRYVKGLDDRPGILSLALKTQVDGKTGQAVTRGVPFVVPGGRFNEMYGWDSYFETLGLLLDGRIELGKSMVDNFVYMIEHYNKILNANRSYYLTRSQPPFLTDMVLEVRKKLEQKPSYTQPELKRWLARCFRACVKELLSVWLAAPRLDPATGLSCYHTEGIGMPPETESSHFDHILEPYAHRHGMDVETFKAKYAAEEVDDPDLDEYFVHDRAVRESGHDTTYRFERKCADLATIDLNSLLYRYAMDVADVVRDDFRDCFRPYFTVTATSSLFHLIARRIRQQVNKYNWNAKEGIFFDYNVREETQDVYETVTTLWALWGGLATPEQAQRVVNETKRRFEVVGGLVAGTEESRGRVGLDRPNRQWDYPYGWAPHQMLAWAGCAKYGMREIGERWAYRWLYTITKSFVDFNGVVPEKFDVVNMTHKVNVEYGNVGTDFKFIPREGFGWMNSSFVVGLEYLRPAWKRALAIVTDPDTLFYRTEKRNREKLLREAAEKERMEQEAAARAKKEGDSV